MIIVICKGFILKPAFLPVFVIGLDRQDACLTEYLHNIVNNYPLFMAIYYPKHPAKKHHYHLNYSH